MAPLFLASLLFHSLSAASAAGPKANSAATGAAKGFLEDHSEVDSKVFRQNILDATVAMMGCGGQLAGDKLSAIESALLPMWRTMPKNNYGYVERRSLRYLVSRYFVQRSSMMVRGFEPTRPVNHSHWGVADILSEQVPGYVESVLESKHAEQHGFSLEDAVHMVAMLDQLIFDSESTILEEAYKSKGMSTQSAISHQELTQVIEAYFVHWILGYYKEGVSVLMANRALLLETVPHWETTVAFGAGQIKLLEFERQRTPQPYRGKDTWAKMYSLQDAHKVVGSITSSFQSFWESECASMKKTLVGMDEHRTGRVPLSRFYASAIDTDWRFRESEAYLRELGALDETSRWNAKQVIIPNYLQAALNCIVSTPHYRVCCASECEAHLRELEAEIGAPVAEPDTILALVENMTSPVSLDDEYSSPQLGSSLKAQLRQVAETHAGKVPLHGRLFAQWLHYVFPHECPFPHKTGSVTSVGPTEFGDDFVAQSEEMKKLARNASAADARLVAGREELHWMSQWSEEEEFIVDYSHELHNGRWSLMGGLAVIGGLGAVALFRFASSTSSCSQGRGASGFGRKMDSAEPIGASVKDLKAHWV